MKDDTVRLVQRTDKRAQFGAENALHRDVFRGHDMDLDSARAQRSSNLESDETCAHDDRFLRLACPFHDGLAVGKRSKEEDLRWIGAFNRNPDRISAGGEQQRAVRETPARVGANSFGLRVQICDATLLDQLDFVLAVPLGRTQWNPVIGCGPGKKILGEIRPIARRICVSADHRHRARISFAAQHLSRRQSRRTATDDDYGRGMLPVGEARCCSRDLLSDIDLASLLSNTPALNRVQRGGVKSLAAAQIEAGMMPWAAYLVAVDEALGERPVIMRTEGAYGKELCSAPHQQDILSPNNSLQLCSIRNALGRNALVEIRLLCSFHTHSTVAAILLCPASVGIVLRIGGVGVRHCRRVEAHLSPGITDFVGDRTPNAGAKCAPRCANQRRLRPNHAARIPVTTPAAKTIPTACIGFRLTTCLASSIASSAARRPCLIVRSADRTPSSTASVTTAFILVTSRKTSSTVAGFCNKSTDIRFVLISLFIAVSGRRHRQSNACDVI